MSKSKLFAGRRFAVVGLGRNGLPAATALAAMGAEVVAWDDGAAPRDAARATGLTVTDPTASIGTFDALVLSPGIPHLLPKPHPIAAAARDAGIPILSDADLLFQAVRKSGSRARFAGITGTNGKSTTTALLHHILQGAGIPSAAGGNLGTAALALPLLGDDGVYVLEMSSYMLERLATLRFDVAALLNLSADHIDRHGDMAGYAAAKHAVFHRQEASDVAVIGIDDATEPDLATAARVIRISGHRPADVWADGTTLRDQDGCIVDLRHAPSLPGSHNAQNAAAAAALARALGVGRDVIAARMKDYPGLPHRQQNVGTVDGVVFVNDSKATNADSAARALACYDRLIWIAGGMAKEGGIDPLAAFFPRIAAAFLIGRDAPLLAHTLTSHGVPHSVLDTLDAAVPAAFAAAQRLGVPVVLLSPACASFDQFAGFDARGDRFAALAEKLATLPMGAA